MMPFQVSQLKRKKSKRKKENKSFQDMFFTKKNETLKNESENLSENHYSELDNNPYVPFSFVNNQSFPNDLQQNVNYNQHVVSNFNNQNNSKQPSQIDDNLWNEFQGS